MLWYCCCFFRTYVSLTFRKLWERSWKVRLKNNTGHVLLRMWLEKRMEENAITTYHNHTKSSKLGLHLNAQEDLIKLSQLVQWMSVIQFFNASHLKSSLLHLHLYNSSLIESMEWISGYPCNVQTRNPWTSIIFQGEVLGCCNQRLSCLAPDGEATRGSKRLHNERPSEGRLLALISRLCCSWGIRGIHGGWVWSYLIWGRPWLGGFGCRVFEDMTRMISHDLWVVKKIPEWYQCWTK